MIHARRRRSIRAAIARSGFSENGEAKQATRHCLITAARTHLTHPPFSIFTLAGIEGHCVKLFRETWPQARIVAIDRQNSATRFTKAHHYERQTATGSIENDILHATLRDYAARRDNLFRRTRDGSKYRLLRYDFPAFDLMFLDTTALYTSSTGIIQHCVEMVDHCATPLAVVGLTFVLGAKRAKQGKEVDVEDVIRNFQGRIKRRTALISEPIRYITNSTMMFFVLQIQA